MPCGDRSRRTARGPRPGQACHLPGAALTRPVGPLASGCRAYQHFADLTGLLESLFIEYGRLVHEPRYESMLAEGLTGATLERLFWTEIDNTRTFFNYTQISDARVLPDIADFFLYSERIRNYRIETWTPFMRRFQEAGTLGPELNLNDFTQWLTYQQVMLCCHPTALGEDDELTHRLVHQFLIGALVLKT